MASKRKRDGEEARTFRSNSAIYQAQRQAAFQGAGESDSSGIFGDILRHSPSRSISQLFFEDQQVRAWYSGTTTAAVDLDTTVNNCRSAVPNPSLCSAMESSQSTSERARPGENETPSSSQVTTNSTQETLQEIHNTPPCTTECSGADVYSKAELLRLDSGNLISAPTPETLEAIQQKAIHQMTQASEELEPCCVCELGYIGDEIRHETLTQALVQSMTKCLDTPKTSVIPGFVVDQYDASHLGLRLKGLMLFPPAIRKEGTTITISICSSCLGHITRRCVTTPPVNAIANGNFIGHLPQQFDKLTRTDEQAVALVLPCVSLSVVTGGACKTIKSHHYVVRNTEGPIVEMLPRDLASKVRVTMVGSMTRAQAAAYRKRYDVNLTLCKTFLKFLDQNSREYSARVCPGEQETIRQSRVSPTSVIIKNSVLPDEMHEEDDLVNDIRDEGTYSSFGSRVDERNDPSIEQSWIGASSLLLRPQDFDWTDVLVRKSNAYVSMPCWGVCVRMFPTLFPGGGGLSEPRRIRMSVRSWILRCLRIYGHRFEEHYAFLLLAFDYLALQNARETLYVRMNVKRTAINAAEVSTSTVTEGIKYLKYLASCRARGIKPKTPEANVQRINDIRKGFHIPESAFYGSNVGRMRARHDLFGMMKKFGPLNLFFTVSPDSAGTYAISIQSGKLSKKVVDDANTILLPNRAERKAIAAAHPVECARYFLRVMHTVIEVLLGWSQDAHAPKRGGGIFGVVRAFGAAAKTQRAGDLHAHFAVWLHGFPVTSRLLDGEVCNNDFKKRLIELVDGVLVTNPPSICDENKCHVCGADDSVQPVLPEIDVFRRPTLGAAPPVTAKCIRCEAKFKDQEVIDATIQNLADELHIRIDSQWNDFQKCQPPQLANTELTTSLIVRDVQTHYWNHCRSCFKKTTRTPNASVCRFLKPEEVHLGPTDITEDGKLHLHRSIGCEYVNAYNPVVMNVLKCNHDAQFVLNSGAKDVAAYIVKYCFKRQNPVENRAALFLAAFAKAVGRTYTFPPETTPMEQGFRILGSMLYSVTNGQEVAAPMAALYVLNKTPFWFSHEFFHFNMGNLLRRHDDSVEISISQHTCVGDNSAASKIPVDDTLERYWRRAKTLEHVSLIEICEEYKYSASKLTPTDGNSSIARAIYTKLHSTKVAVLCGRQLPDISSHLECEEF